MAKIPKNRSDKDMMQGYEEEETLADVLLKRERQAAVRKRHRNLLPILHARG